MFLQKMLGWVRGDSPAFYGEGEPGQPLAINNRGELIVVQGLPELIELVRMGQSWQVSLSTGLAALTALPTTTAGLSLWNGEAGDAAKAYVIDSFGSVEEVIDATQADTTAIFACNNVGVVTAPTDAGLTIRSLSGKKYGGLARTVSGATITNDGWFGHGAEGQAPLAPAVAGANWKINEVKLRVPYLVRAGGMFNVVAVKAGAAAAAQQFYFVRWHEARLRMP
jgi:hypothetical protein